MAYQELKPILERPNDYEAIERYIVELLRDQVYLPLIEELGEPETTIKNSIDGLLTEIARGNIVFSNGVFSGKFNSESSRELKKLGAKWSKGEWRIPLSKLPLNVRAAISTSLHRFEETLKKVDKKLSKMLPADIADQFQAADLFDKALWKVEKSFQKTVKGITIAPSLTKEQSKKIAAEYNNNLKLPIQDWSQKEIKELRAKIKEHAFAGGRYEDVVKEIQKSYGVATRKAKFLARQETSLLMAKFKETRYTDVGINEYKWGCVVGSANHPVRPMHKALQGKTFSWDAPPVTNPEGGRNNPGQDFNCRCFARPLVKF